MGMGEIVRGEDAKRTTIPEQQPRIMILDARGSCGAWQRLNRPLTRG